VSLTATSELASNTPQMINPLLYHIQVAQPIINHVQHHAIACPQVVATSGDDPVVSVAPGVVGIAPLFLEYSDLLGMVSKYHGVCQGLMYLRCSE
jgi:hypothetical protein